MQKSEILNPGKDPELLVFVVLLILSQFHPFFAKWHRWNQVHIFAATIHQGEATDWESCEMMHGPIAVKGG